MLHTLCFQEKKLLLHSSHGENRRRGVSVRTTFQMVAVKDVGLVYLFVHRLTWQGGLVPGVPKMQVSGVGPAQPPVPETLESKKEGRMSQGNPSLSQGKEFSC